MQKAFLILSCLSLSFISHDLLHLILPMFTFVLGVPCLVLLYFPHLYFLLCNTSFCHSYKSPSSIIFRKPSQVLMLIWHPPSVCAPTSLEYNFLSLPLPPCAESLQSWPTPCDPMDCSPRILQARVLEWVAIPPLGDLPKDWTCVSCLLHWQVGSLPLTPPRRIANVWGSHWFIFLFPLNYKSQCLFLLCISNI